MLGVVEDLLKLVRGLRELRGLVSTVNYDGSSSHYRESANSLGAFDSYK